MDDIDVSGEMKREDYESMTMPLLERLSALCKKAMEDAGIKDVSTLHGVSQFCKTRITQALWYGLH